ncbi:BEN domain-containing protein 2 isoform X1 [Pygocentrus nattereri]|uniref:BEN domain-containing protein n=1 Tax=Pygocentrus nattereri TaxID=42514 RepID=A0AAR2L6V7_PYGNA|nr:BEN domain-containing protein 2 isoform X1 [Pygocentrus nattereri]XP_037397448.1 BEN domain-containing protein 2 isoform X1 [Pygocentrus nattereri]XP_037397449.1 BEN domain-containing protein 2 isoform X1 [Pygocentrus nattereri]XP_037397450.1 BEN domain-containing protein 2 isoform X1 [Pygocentrus nattereri]
MSAVEQEALLDDITCVEMESNSVDEGEMVASTEIFGADPLRTLGEILAYCQVMYGAIQKLDEKLELLQARVTNIQADHLSPPVKTAPLHSEVADVASSFLNLQRRLSSPPPSPPVEDMKPAVFIQTPEIQTFFQPASTSAVSSLSAHAPPHTMKKMMLKNQLKKPQHPYSHTISPAEHTGGERFILPIPFLRKASTMPKPTSAARFLLRSIFSHQELVQGSTKGDPAKGLNMLDPNKISAIQEWLQKRYPKHDLGDKGKDWRACLTVMNKGARYIRQMDKKRNVRNVQGVNAGSRLALGSSSLDFKISTLTSPNADEQPRSASPVSHMEPQPTAEIDVELSDSDHDDLRGQNLLTSTFRAESDPERSTDNEELSDQEDHVYLGCPDRGVKVPQYAMYTAWQRPNAPLVARYLVKFIFPEDVLVRSNVYGNAEYGMEPLDHNKITALREYLCERFPQMKLEEDGHDWKACVDAINSCIRKTRHKCKKLSR